MCDFSLHSVRSRPAKVGDKLVTRDFGTGTRGFAAADDSGLAVCVMAGTELAFAEEVKHFRKGPAALLWITETINYRTAIFRQVNKGEASAHHASSKTVSNTVRPSGNSSASSGGNSAATARAASDHG